jgi:hypothetical protein
MSYHSNDGGDDEDTNVDEQAVCIAPNIGNNSSDLHSQPLSN